MQTLYTSFSYSFSVAKANKLLKEMFNYLEEGKRNINQMLLTSKNTITELYRTESYIEQLKAIIIRLERLLDVKDNADKQAPEETKKTKEYAKLINDIVTEFHYLKATSEAMEDNIYQIKKSDSFQFEISARITELRKKVIKMITKTEKYGAFLKRHYDYFLLNCFSNSDILNSSVVGRP